MGGCSRSSVCMYVCVFSNTSGLSCIIDDVKYNEIFCSGGGGGVNTFFDTLNNKKTKQKGEVGLPM